MANQTDHPEAGSGTRGSTKRRVAVLSVVLMAGALAGTVVAAGASDPEPQGPREGESQIDFQKRLFDEEAEARSVTADELTRQMMEESDVTAVVTCPGDDLPTWVSGDIDLDQRVKMSSPTSSEPVGWTTRGALSGPCAPALYEAAVQSGVPGPEVYALGSNGEVVGFAARQGFVPKAVADHPALVSDYLAALSELDVNTLRQIETAASKD